MLIHGSLEFMNTKYSKIQHITSHVIDVDILLYPRQKPVPIRQSPPAVGGGRGVGKIFTEIPWSNQVSEDGIVELVYWRMSNTSSGLAALVLWKSVEIRTTPDQTFSGRGVVQRIPEGQPKYCLNRTFNTCHNPPLLGGI